MSGPTMSGISHQPPDLPPAGADRDRPASCLLDLIAVIGSQTNASTAWCDTDDIQRVLKIQITFVVADPPQVSYFYAYCIGSGFTENPTILHTEGNLALLQIGVEKWNYFGLDRYAFYVYDANGGPNGEPSLTVLPQPSGSGVIQRSQIGLLPGGTHGTAGGYPLHTHGYSHSHDYHVAALSNTSGPLHFELYLYSSKTRTWTVKKPVLILNEQQQQAGEFRHITSEVIVVGGDYGTMGFVDHSRGILFCNVLQGDCPHLYYVPLPTPLHDSRLDLLHALRVCNISVDTKGDRIRFVELCLHGKTHGWQAVTWSRSAASNNLEEGWRQECDLFPSQLLSGDLPEQLPRESCWDDRGGPAPPTTRELKRMYTEFPTLSLHDHNTLYLMISCHFVAWDRWVIAVDMANMTVQDVAHYRRSEKVRLKLRHSNISNHLNMGPSPAAPEPEKVKVEQQDVVASEEVKEKKKRMTDEDDVTASTPAKKIKMEEVTEAVEEEKSEKKKNKDKGEPGSAVLVAVKEEKSDLSDEEKGGSEKKEKKKSKEGGDAVDQESAEAEKSDKKKEKKKKRKEAEEAQ